MNEAGTPFSPQFLKVLFGELVDAAGKQDAAAAILGISRQYVSDMSNTRNPEHAKAVPNWGHVWALEASIGRSVVFRKLAEAIEPPAPSATGCPLKEAHDVFRAVADLGPLAMDVKSGAPGAVEAFMKAAGAVARELTEAESAVRHSNVTQMKGAA